MPAAGRRTQLFHLIFTEPGDHTLAHPCTRSMCFHMDLTNSYYWIVRAHQNEESGECDLNTHKVTPIHYDLGKHRMASAVCHQQLGQLIIS